MNGTVGSSSAFPAADWRGLTKREYFAALIFAAMQGNPADSTLSVEGEARHAVKRADLLIAALNGF